MDSNLQRLGVPQGNSNSFHCWSEAAELPSRPRGASGFRIQAASNSRQASSWALSSSTPSFCPLSKRGITGAILTLRIPSARIHSPYRFVIRHTRHQQEQGQNEGVETPTAASVVYGAETQTTVDSAGVQTSMCPSGMASWRISSPRPC